MKKELLFLYEENFLGTKVFRHNVILRVLKKLRAVILFPFNGFFQDILYFTVIYTTTYRHIHT